MKKFFGFGKGKKRGLSPSPSDTSSVLSAGYQLQDKDLDKLHRAAYSGDVSKIKQLLRKQDVNQQDNASRTPLHLACANGQTDVVSMLVENHAKVNLCDSENRSPLMKAIQCQQESCAAVLLGHNADPNVVDVNGNAALHFAARIPSITIASQLLEHGADIDAPNKDGCTPLMLATIENNEEMVEFLLREGANINSKDVNERTSLMVAASNGHIGLVKMLLEHDADISTQDEKGWSADDHAVMHGHHACSHLIIEHSSRKKSSDPFRSTAKRRGTSGLSNPNKDVDGVFTLGSPATDKAELRVTPKQTSAARDAGKVTDDFSQAESESRASQKSAATDSWPSSDDDFDLSPQKAPKPNLKKLFHTKATVDQKSSFSGAQSVALSPQKHFSSEDESSRGSDDNDPPQPRPFPKAYSFPEPVQLTPGSFTKLSQMPSSLFALKKNDPSDDEADGKEGSDFEDHPEENAIKAALPRTPVEERLPGPADPAVGRKETLMSELGLDEDDVESPWDSEASVASPRKQSSMKLTQSSNEEIFKKKSPVEKEEPRAVGSLLPMEEASPTSPSAHSSTNVKSDVMADLGLDDADDLEDVSELDSTSFSLKVPAIAASIGKFTKEPLEAKARTTAPGPLNNASSLPPMSKRSDSEEEDNGHAALNQNLLTPSKKDLQQTESSDEFSEGSSAAAVEERKTADSLSPMKEVFSSVSSARTSEGYTKSDSVMKGALTQANSKSLVHQKGKGESERLQLISDSDNSHGDGKAVQRRPTLSDLQNKPKQMARDRLSKGKDSSEGSKNTRLIKKSGLRKPRIQHRATTNGNPMDAFDDSSLSETSQEDAGRNGNQYLSGNKIDADEFSQSSDTASDAIDSPTFRNAMLIMEELTADCPSSLNLIKIEDIIRQYERSLQKETGRYALLADKVKSMETDNKDLQQLAERNRELTSRLEHQKVEWESDLNHLRFMLKQEEEKRKSAEMLYDKGRDQLRKKEDQCCKEMEEKQQLEMALRNMEREVRSLSNNVKKAEEERHEAQRLLSQERNARALQEDFLNNLRRKNEEEEAARIIMTKTAEAHSQPAESSEREKDLLQRNRTLQDEITLSRQELEKVQRLNEEEKRQYAEDIDMLKERVDDLKRDLKVNEESLTQNLIQYNGQLNALRTEATIFCTKLEHEKQAKERLETELESLRSRLTSALQELEKSQTSKTDTERSLQRERDEWMRSKDKLSYDLANSQENNKNLCQQLGKAEAKCNDLECELHRKGLSLQERVVLVESTQRELTQAQCRIKELESTLTLEKDQFNKSTIKQESARERLAQVQNENLQLRQQLDDLQSKGVIKDKAVSDVQDRFTDIFGKLRSDTERQVFLVEERNKDLINKSNELREQIYRLETDKVEGESARRQLQQELADAFKKLSMSEASLEVITRYRNDLEEEKQNFHKELEKCKNKLQDLEEQYIQSERLNHQLKNLLDDKEREIAAAVQKAQEFAAAKAAAEKSAKQLEEHVQKLEIENAKIEATAKHQTNQIEILQRELQESIANRKRMEDLVTSLQSSKMGLEDKLNQQAYKQTAVSLTAQESHNMWEDELKSRSRLGIRLAELDREKAELAEQVDRERKKVKKLAEKKRSMDSRFDEEVKRSGDLHRELSGMKRLLKTAKKKLKEYESSGNQQSKSDGTTAHKNLDDEPEFCRLKDKMEQLSVTLERESMRHKQLESRNRELQDELYSMALSHKKQERHEKGRRHLEDEVTDLKRHLDSSKMDQSTMESFKREIEEKGRQEVRQKLEDVNLFLQTQAAAQDSLEQIRAATDASLRSQLESRIQDLETELHKIKSAQKESECQKESSQTELDRFKELYAEEMKMRKSLAGKLERTYERLEEANTKLLNERQRSKSLIASSIMSGNLGPSPVLDVSPLGLHSRSLTLNGGFGPGGSFLSSTGNGLTTNRMDSYLAQVQLDLEKSIARELQQANTGPETGYTRVPPVGSTAATVRIPDADLDPLSRTTQQYLEVLKKNNML